MRALALAQLMLLLVAVALLRRRLLAAMPSGWVAWPTPPVVRPWAVLAFEELACRLCRDLLTALHFGVNTNARDAVGVEIPPPSKTGCACPSGSTCCASDRVRRSAWRGGLSLKTTTLMPVPTPMPAWVRVWTRIAMHRFAQSESRCLSDCCRWMKLHYAGSGRAGGEVGRAAYCPCAATACSATPRVTG